MDRNGIGTDATIHEHIKTIQERGYAVKVTKFIRNYILAQYIYIFFLKIYIYGNCKIQNFWIITLLCIFLALLVLSITCSLKTIGIILTILTLIINKL